MAGKRLKNDSSLTDLGEPLLKGLALLHFGEVVVVEGHVGHDGLLVRMREQHVLHLQQLHDLKLALSHGEGVLQVAAGLVAVEAAVIEEVRPGEEEQEEEEAAGMFERRNNETVSAEDRRLRGVSSCEGPPPVRVDEGVERQPISPAGREVLHVHVAVARRLPLTPDEQSLLG